MIYLVRPPKNEMQNKEKITAEQLDVDTLGLLLFNACATAKLRITFLSPAQNRLCVLEVSVCSCIEDL